MRDALASDIVDDSVSQPHVFDTGTASHVRAHPTVGALTSRESLVKLESQAVIGHDTTLPIEKDHAGSKRTQVAREQTHRERLDIASAARVTRHVREQSDFSWIGRLGQQAASQCGIDRGKKRRCLEARLVWRKKLKGNRRSAEHHWTRKRERKHSTWQAWGGRDAVAYKAAMRRPEERRRLQELASWMDRSREEGARPARKDRRLRNLREQWRRQQRQKPWSPQEGREILRARLRDPYYVGHCRALTEWRAASRRQKSQAMLDSRCLSARALASRASLPLAALAPLAADFVPLPSQHAQLILAWMPDVRPAVLSEMPGVMYSDRGQVTADWAQDHQLVDETCSVAVRKESATDRRIRQCREACLCLCSMCRNMAQRMLKSFNKVLHGMLPKRVLGTPSELCDAAGHAAHRGREGEYPAGACPAGHHRRGHREPRKKTKEELRAICKELQIHLTGDETNPQLTRKNKEKRKPTPADDTVADFGMYRGRTYEWIWRHDPGYCAWATDLAEYIENRRQRQHQAASGGASASASAAPASSPATLSASKDTVDDPEAEIEKLRQQMEELKSELSSLRRETVERDTDRKST